MGIRSILPEQWRQLRDLLLPLLWKDAEEMKNNIKHKLYLISIDHTAAGHTELILCASTLKKARALYGKKDAYRMHIYRPVNGECFPLVHGAKYRRLRKMSEFELNL